MTVDRETIAAYEARSREYAKRTGGRLEPGLKAFAARLPAGGHVLDLGCGPGDASRYLLDCGCTVDAIDATPAMVAAAKDLGVDAHVASFADVDGQSIYDGVWASYSLLHAPRTEMPDNLMRLRRAIKDGGWLHIGLKLGTGEHRDVLGRLYVYYTEEELVGLLEAAGFTPQERETSKGVGLDGTAYEGIWMHAHA